MRSSLHTLSRRFATICLVFGATQALAQGGFERDNFRDIRWVGRGNTGVASINDGTALFYNPAGVARIRGYGMEILNPMLGANQNFIGSFQSFTTLSEAETLGAKLLPFMGKSLAMQGGAFPYFHGPGFAAGFWDYLDFGMTYRDPVNPMLEADARNDWGFILGKGWTLIPNQLFIGASIRYQNRRALQEDLTAGTVLSIPSSELMGLMRTGMAFGINAGVQYVHENTSKSQFFALGFAWEDVGNTAFQLIEGVDDLLRQNQQMNAGFTYGIVSSAATLQFLFDVRQLNNVDMSFTKKINFGVDVDVLNLNLRAGFHQGYWSAGTSLYIFPVLSLDFATYGEEIDTLASSRMNRYWLMGLRAGVSLEKGARAKRKQRYTLDHL